MPNLFVTALTFFAGSFLSKIVFRVLYLVGIGYVALEGIDAYLEPIQAYVEAQAAEATSFGGMATYAFLELQTPAVIAILFTAYSYALGIKALGVARRAISKG